MRLVGRIIPIDTGGSALPFHVSRVTEYKGCIPSDVSTHALFAQLVTVCVMFKLHSALTKSCAYSSHQRLRMFAKRLTVLPLDFNGFYCTCVRSDAENRTAYRFHAIIIMVLCVAWTRFLASATVLFRPLASPVPSGHAHAFTAHPHQCLQDLIPGPEIPLGCPRSTFLVGCEIVLSRALMWRGYKRPNTLYITRTNCSC